MATAAVSTTKRRDWRLIIWRSVAALGALLFLIALPGLLALIEPWLLITTDHPGYTAEGHRFHEAHWGVIHGLLYAGCLIALLRKPREQPLLVQFFGVAVLIETIGYALVSSPDPMMLAILAIVIAAYPAPRALVSVSRAGPVSIPLLGLSVLLAALLLPDVGRLAHLQLAGLGGEHATENHWILTANLEMMLIVGGLLAATRRPGWQALGVIVGLALVYLGVASISLPYYAGSWNLWGGALATVGGWGFIGATLWEARHTEARRKLAGRAGGWLPYALIVLAGCVVAVVATAPWSSTASSDKATPAGATILGARNYQFDRLEVQAHAGQPMTLRLDNHDGTAHQFDLDESNVHVAMPPGQQAVAQFTPTRPGTYTFYCILHVDRATKQGMSGKLVVLP